MCPQSRGIFEPRDVRDPRRDRQVTASRRSTMTTRRAPIGRQLAVFACVICTAAALPGGLSLPATALAVGATPGVALGGDGAGWQGHTQRFVAVPAPVGTRVTELRRAGGAGLRSQTIAGRFGIPL